ncbi:MAG TPA: aldo/keto reductase [Dehalococcoidia bacterium]|nr:aldo/keto reductase [Dehalococcoidia bacterium]
MQYRNMGRTGLKVSRICLGAMNYGDPVSETESISIMKRAFDAGVNFIDTANIYAGTKSEEIVGKGVKGDRHSYVIATKVGTPVGPGPRDVGLSRKHIMQAAEDSLRRLQTDYIDLYYAHIPDFGTPLEETLRAMDDLVHQGKVRYLGCSNFSAWMLGKALRISEVQNLARFDCIEPPYNLLTRDIEMEILPLCAEEGIGLCVYNPLAGEMLTGRHEFGKPPAEGRFTHEMYGPGYLERYWSEVNFKAVERIKEIASERGISLPQFALAWVLNNELVTSVLSGTTAIDQLEENLGTIDIVLSPEELRACDDVWQMFRPPRYHYAKKP